MRKLHWSGGKIVYIGAIGSPARALILTRQHGLESTGQMETGISQPSGLAPPVALFLES